MRNFIEILLKEHHYQVVTAEDGDQALLRLAEQPISLLIVDIMMPHMTGLELTESLRQSHSQVPIIMITAKETSDMMRRGFSVGTDDYLKKPFDSDELLMRVKALLRRSKIATENQLRIGDLLFDLDNFTVTTGKKNSLIPRKEFQLIFKLLSYPGKTFTRNQLMDDIWGYETETDAKTVNVHINRLRERFKEELAFSIVTVHGLGYKVVINE